MPASEAVAACALAVCGIAMAVAVACDLRARIIPVEACAALAVAGGTFQAYVAGAEGLAAGALHGGVIVAGCCLANRMARRGGDDPVGWGDIRCMGALSLASGSFAPLGFAVCYGAAAVAALAGLASRRLSVRDGMPMAPFLALWLMCAALCC